MYPGRLDPDPHLAGAGLGIGDLAGDEDLGASVVVLDDGEHVDLRLCRVDRRSVRPEADVRSRVSSDPAARP
ncbi:hypothetical protein Pdca_12460 [Pseudonocardia autotrophica]|nr:hypothetical protein Pdca_12460 [Pseudonocardia autotrophica]